MLAKDLKEYTPLTEGQIHLLESLAAIQTQLNLRVTNKKNLLAELRQEKRRLHLLPTFPFIHLL